MTRELADSILLTVDRSLGSYNQTRSILLDDCKGVFRTDGFTDTFVAELSITGPLDDNQIPKNKKDEVAVTVFRAIAKSDGKLFVRVFYHQLSMLATALMAYIEPS